jgi:hypothetical protein
MELTFTNNDAQDEAGRFRYGTTLVDIGRLPRRIGRTTKRRVGGYLVRIVGCCIPKERKLRV